MHKIVDKIKKETLSLKKRGIPDGSHFIATFSDDSLAHESDYSWHDFSEEQIVDFMGKKKHVRICKHKVKKLLVKYGDLETTVEPEEGESIYQAIRSCATFYPDGTVGHQNIGRIVGLVKNGKVIEERFLDGRINQIVGARFSI